MKMLDKGWIDRALSKDAISRIVLDAVDVEGDKHKVERYDSAAGREAEHLCDEITRDAINYAAGLGGVQRFVVTALDDEGETLTRTAFNIDGGSHGDGESGAGLSEPPTNTGIVSQLMRHLESKERQFNGTVGGTLQLLTTTIKELRAENETLRKERSEQMALTEELLTKKHQRDLATRESEAKLDMQKRALEQVQKAAPYLLAKLTGRDVEDVFVRPQVSNVEAAAFKLGESLNGNEIEAMLQAGVSKETMTVVLTLLEQITKAQSITAKEKTALERKQNDQIFGSLVKNGGAQ